MNRNHTLILTLLVALLFRVASASFVKQDANGNAVLTLDTNTQRRIELQIQTLVPIAHSPEMKGYGKVIDPTPLVTEVAEIASDQAAYAASSNDLVRLKILESQGNTSAHAVQTAEAAALRDQLAFQSARDRLTLSWGNAMAEQKDLPAFIQTVISRKALMVRIDFPTATALPLTPLGARIVSLSGNVTDGQFLSTVPAVDPEMQGVGFIFTTKPEPRPLLFGEAVTGYLQFKEAPVMGIVVPRNAVIRSQGAAWVYVKTGDEAFTRIEIDLRQPVTAGWFVTNGVAAGTQVVTSPPQLLLSEEMKSTMTMDER
jgi:hypothetical protein